MKIKALGAIVAIVSALGLSAAHAQIVPFANTFNLTRGDLDALSAALRPILRDPDAKVGAEGSWSNDKTGSSGTATLTKRLNLGQFKDCKRIQNDIHVGGTKDPNRFIIDYCQVEDGTWKSYP